jgi:hypothetical protein
VSVSLLTSAGGDDDVRLHFRDAGCEPLVVPAASRSRGSNRDVEIPHVLFPVCVSTRVDVPYNILYGVPMYDLQGGVTLLNILLS